MLYLGCHLSSSKGYAAMGRTALSIGANTFQFFTRNPRGGAAKSADPADAAVLVQMQQDGQLGRVVAHAPYTLNPCSKDERTREFAREVFESDLQRMELTLSLIHIFKPARLAVICTEAVDGRLDIRLREIDGKRLDQRRADKLPQRLFGQTGDPE